MNKSKARLLYASQVFLIQLRVAFIVVAMITLVSPLSALGTNPTTLYTPDLSLFVDGKPVTFPDAQPFVNGDFRTMVPVRFVTEALGARVIWQESTQTVQIQMSGITIEMPINTKDILVNQQTRAMDTQAILKDGRVMVPVRFVAENLRSTVGFESTLNRVNIETSDYNALDEMTILVYLNGSDLESAYDDTLKTIGGAGTSDLKEMMSVGSSAAVNVLIETGGTKEWLNKEINPAINQRFLVEKGALKPLQNLTKLNMGESKTLSDYLEWGIKNYPAKRYALILWNHGGGPIVGYGLDEWFDGDALTLKELDQSLSKATKATGAYFSFIGFDACLMSSLETANTLKPYTDYLLASQELEPGHGWDYQVLLKNLVTNPKIPITNLLKATALGFEQQAKSQETESDITLALLSLKHLDPLNAQVAALFASLNQKIKTPDGLHKTATELADSKSFGGNTKEQGFTNLVDLLDFTARLSSNDPAQIETMRKALQDVVRFQVRGPIHQTASGLSLYLPYRAPEDFSWQLPIHKALTLPGSLLQFVTLFSESLMDKTAQEPMTFKIEGPDNTTHQYTLVVPENQIEQVSDVYLSLHQYIKTGRERYRQLGYDALINEDSPGRFTSAFDGAWTLLQGQPVMLQILENTQEYIRYEIPLKLNGEEANLLALWHYDDKLEAGGYYEILGARRVVDSATNMPDRKLILLKAGDKITLKYTSYYFGQDAFETEWGNEFTLKSPFELIYSEIDPTQYLLTFMLYDFAGTLYESDYLEIQP